MTPRSWLFVPGDSSHKLQKALQSGADALILDLEDSVGASQKGDARHFVRNLLRQSHAPGHPELWVRINPIRTEDAPRDLAMVAAARPAGIVLPKAEGGADVAHLAAQLDALEIPGATPTARAKILPIVTETPSSMFRLASYGGASERLAGLTWGAEDLSAAVGATANRDAGGALTPLYELARSLCCVGAAAAEVPAIETIYPDFGDADGLRSYAERGRRDGFSGMMAIHPAQVSVINACFMPSHEDVVRARRIVDLFAHSPGSGVQSLDRQMLDLPHLKQAEALLERAKRLGVAKPKNA